ncbi:MAG: ATP-binding protein, partial [Acidobacteriota bacterium]|nr:ATP-binding protein [Acidobacteriota bacterium]
MPAALLLVDRAEGVRFQNRAATMLSGPPPDKNALEHYESGFTLAGRDGVELPLAKWPLMRALDGETIAGEDVVVRRRDGRDMPMLISAAPMNDALGQPSGAVVVFQDVSALKAIDRLKDEFVSIVSHELRTPLTSIRGSLQLVLDEPGSVPDDDHRHLVRIALNNCERLIRIINDILDIAKIEAGKTALQLRSCAVRDLVAAAIESVEGMARSAEVAFTIHIPDGLPPVEADADRMTQVLVNLLSNAVKFAPPRSRVSVEAAEAGAMVEISVSDRGRGISPEDLPLLFQKFQQIDASASRSRGGTGLGLAIVRGLVEQHGGTVTVSSRKGEGTRFAFTLPAAASTRALAPLSGAVDVARSARVLVVDDDDDFRTVTKRHLERAGFHVTEARDGSEALEHARKATPDVITLDLLMPGMNGWTLLQSLSDDPTLASVPVVVLSAVADRSGQLGRNVAVVAKASGVDVLMSEIGALLASSASGDILVAEDDDDLRSLLAHALRKRGFTTREARDGADAMSMIDDNV